VRDAPAAHSTASVAWPAADVRDWPRRVRKRPLPGDSVLTVSDRPNPVTGVAGMAARKQTVRAWKRSLVAIPLGIRDHSGA
jgi:hypothetical protein